MDPGAIVIVHLVEPTEKYWGVLSSLGAHGVTVRAINLSSFDDFVAEVSHEPQPAIGLSTLFFPMRRIECMFLDEPVGVVESFADRFERRVGRSVAAYLAVEPAAAPHRGAPDRES